jgi:hypothetical protein
MTTGGNGNPAIRGRGSCRGPEALRRRLAPGVLCAYRAMAHRARVGRTAGRVRGKPTCTEFVPLAHPDEAARKNRPSRPTEGFLKPTNGAVTWLNA